MSKLNIFGERDCNISITKSYCLKLKAVVQQWSNELQETRFYDDNGEYVFGAYELRGRFGPATKLWIAGVDENIAICYKDEFMRYDDMRLEFYKALQDEEKKQYFLRQHDYVEKRR